MVYDLFAIKRVKIWSAKNTVITSQMEADYIESYLFCFENKEGKVLSLQKQWREMAAFY